MGISERRREWERAARAEQREMEDRVLDAAALLDPEDQSLEARQLREAAASLRDHREGELRRLEMALDGAHPVRATGTAVLLEDLPAWSYRGFIATNTRRLRTWRLANGALAAMLTELTTDEGTSITNAAENIAAKLAEEYPGERIVHVEHYGPIGDSPEHFDGMAIVGGRATWWPMSREEVTATYGEIFLTEPE